MEVELRAKSRSQLMRVIGWVLRPFNPAFMERYWTTIGSTIYVPTQHDDEKDWGEAAFRARHRDIIDHEKVHVEQFECWGVLGMAFGYLGPSPFLFIASLAFFGLDTLGGTTPWRQASWLSIVEAIALLPLSVGLAYFRWRIERAAYMVQVRASPRPETIEHVVSVIWTGYLWAWPRPWMRRWFERQLEGKAG